MLYHLKIIFRNISRNKAISLLNVFGLTAGLICTIYLTAWVMHETSYDSFIPDKDNIYRVVLEGVINGEYVVSSACVGGIGPESKRLFPEVTNYVRMNQSYSNSLIRTEEGIFFRADGFAADSTFCNFFPFPPTEGDIYKSLSTKNNIIIVKQLALKCFGEEPAVGKLLYVGDDAFTVAAVLEDIPTNSHLQFDFLVPTLNMPDWWNRELWGGDNAITYLKLNHNPNIHDLNTRITDLVKNQDEFWRTFNIQFTLQNIKDIPYSGMAKWDYAKKSNKRNIYALSAVAFLILLIACINFANLFISSALGRKKMTGIKITSGARKYTIVKEFIIEVLCYIFIAFFAAAVLLKVLHPYLDYLSGAITNINIFSTRFIIISLPVVIITALLTGIFPGFYLARLNPVEILKNTNAVYGSKLNIQKTLVTVQFVIAIGLVITVAVIFKQVNFLMTKNLGFDKENVIYVHTIGGLKDLNAQRRLKDELSRNPNIKTIAYSGGLPTVWNNGMPVSLNYGQDYLAGTEQINVDEDYFDLMGISFIEGDNVFKYSHDSLNYCIVNKRLVDALKLEPSYIDRVLYTGNPENYIIKGVIENINTKALYQVVDPTIYLKQQRQTEEGIILFRIASDYSSAVTAIGNYWRSAFPDMPFEYWYLDQTYDNLYRSEMKAREVLVWFGALAIILTSLGLLAMAYFISEKRTKEIGIRKVNGARISEVMAMLNKDFVKWVVIAFVIASPIAYYAINKWLQNFAYKTSLSWWIFALAGMLALGIALLTVSWQSYRAASRNPVEALRYE